LERQRALQDGGDVRKKTVNKNKKKGSLSFLAPRNTSSPVLSPNKIMIPTYSPPQSSENRPRINQTTSQNKNVQRNQGNKKYVQKTIQDTQKENTDDVQDTYVPNQDTNNNRGNQRGRGRNKNRGAKKYVPKNTTTSPQQEEHVVVNEEFVRVEVRDVETNEQSVFLINRKSLTDTFPVNEREKFENKK